MTASKERMLAVILILRYLSAFNSLDLISSQFSRAINWILFRSFPPHTQSFDVRYFNFSYYNW